MPDMQKLALLLLQKNPQIAQTPMGQQFAQALQSGDVSKLEQMGQNICNSNGVSQEEAYGRAKQFFNL